MSRAVSGVFGTTVATSSSYATSKSQDPAADASPFGEALDRAQSTQSNDSKKAEGASRSDSKSSPAKSEKAATGRGKLPVKKAGTPGDDPQPKVQKKPAPQVAQEPQTDAGQSGGESETDQSAGETAKQEKKAATPADSSTSDTPAVIVQIQNGVSAKPVQPVADSPAKDEQGQRRSQKSPPAATSKVEVSSKNDPSARQPTSAGDGSASAAPATNDATAESQSSEASGKPEKSRLAIQARNPANATADNAPTAAVATAQQSQSPAASSLPQGSAPASQVPTVEPAVPPGRALKKGVDDLMVQGASLQTTTASSAITTAADNASAADDSPAGAPGADFSDVNHPKIVSGIAGRLLPNGGTMQIRLDPPELGAVQVRVEMRDGVMTASFETSNDQATRLLSHSLGDLRTALEAQGVSVQKLQVSQSPKQHQSPTGDGQKDSSQTPQDTASQREQQRKDMVRRMWQKLMGGQDPVDLVA
jgi:flagellar hook-length control protein FliK